eukprot:2344226-Pyramimonas_sp.AAC.1
MEMVEVVLGGGKMGRLERSPMSSPVSQRFSQAFQGRKTRRKTSKNTWRKNDEEAEHDVEDAEDGRRSEERLGSSPPARTAETVTANFLAEQAADPKGMAPACWVTTLPGCQLSHRKCRLSK